MERPEFDVAFEGGKKARWVALVRDKEAAKSDLAAARAENEKLTADIAAAHALLRERLAVLDVGHDTFDKPRKCRVCLWNDKVRAELAKKGKGE